MGYKKIVQQKIKEFEIREFISGSLRHVGLSNSKLQMTPLGEKVIVDAARPGLIVGRKGQTIKKLTQQLKTKFHLENPQIEINEVENPNLDALIVAERIANSLERFGSARFKAIGHRVLSDVMRAGALGVEVLVSGKVPSSRARRWRFYKGYLKKSGHIAMTDVSIAYAAARLKTGVVGIQVRIMPPIELPDKMNLRTEEEIERMKEVRENNIEIKKKTKKRKRKSSKKATAKKEAPNANKSTKVKEESKVETGEVKTKTPKVEEKPEVPKTKEKAE
jgi:small subunit ribosomal protein S3